LNFRAVLESTKSDDFDDVTQNAITFLRSQRMHKVSHVLVVLTHISDLQKDPPGSLQSSCRFNSRGAHRGYSSPSRLEHAYNFSGQQGYVESLSTNIWPLSLPTSRGLFGRSYLDDCMDGNPFLFSPIKKNKSQANKVCIKKPI
jgi:hypothetical protein